MKTSMFTLLLLSAILEMTHQQVFAHRQSGAQSCFAKAKVSYTLCHNDAMVNRSGVKQAWALKQCDIKLTSATRWCDVKQANLALAASAPSRRLNRKLAMSHVQCLRAAQENLVNCQLEVARMPTWTQGEADAVKAAAKACHNEFDNDQDECDGRQSSGKNML